MLTPRPPNPLLILILALSPALGFAQGGTISGTVTLEGEAPPPTALETQGDPLCTHGPMPDQATQVGPANRVPWAFVWIAKGLSGDFPPSHAPVVVDQSGCLFAPHVFGVQRGQPVTFRNNDPLMHNVHTKPVANRELNAVLFQKGMEKETIFASEEYAIPITCDVHPWMKSYAWVMAHPFFAVTDAEGKFTLKDVPPGKYAVAIWHETFQGKGKLVEVPAGGAPTIDFLVRQPAH